MIYAINYADSKYRKAQKANTKSAYKKGKVDRVIEYGPESLDVEFRKKNGTILSIPRGNGVWLWKPYIILKTLKDTKVDDYLIYSDSGSVYLNDVKYLINAMEFYKQDIMCFEIEDCIEKRYTKPILFEMLGCDNNEIKNSKQILATFILCKNTDWTVKFVEKWLYYAENKKFIFDENPELIKQKYPYYIAHREDQSILSLLYKMEKLKIFRDPSQWGNGQGIREVIRRYKDRKENKSIEQYPTIFLCHRAKRYNQKIRIRTWLRSLFPDFFK